MTNNQLTKIEIDNYKAFNGFVMRLCPQEGLNLNLLIGRNGSGKSSFLDALAEIACNNLTSAPDNPYVFFEQFCNAFKQNKIDRCGFLYELNGKDETFEEQFLSDGENGFMSRYALLYLISKTTNEKFLILLDEPETHFNEHWKRYFLKLLCDVLAQKDTDVFVATHSAMLVSDVKKHELHRFELNDNEIISNDCLLNSYGANIIDIGQILFKMEGNIGERAKDEIEKLLNSNSKKDIEKIERLLSEVGPGEYRWRLRAKLQELMSQKKVTVPVCPLVRKRRKYA